MPRLLDPTPRRLMRHTVTIERDMGREGEDYNARGNVIHDWQKIGSTQAHIENLTGSEQQIGRRVYAQATHRFTIRYWKGLKRTDSFVWRGKRFQISWIDDRENAGQEMACLADEC